MKRPRNRTLAVAALVLVLAAAAAGAFVLVHGNSTANARSATPPFARQGGGPANSAAFQQFRQCMAANGVTLSPGQRPDPTDPTVQKARQACAQYAPQRPSGGNGFGPPANGATTPGT